MPDDGQNGSSRLDRIEAMLEALVQDHRVITEEHLQFRQDLRQLLTAQVLLQDRVTQLAEAQKHTDESLHALINIVDGIIRSRRSSGFYNNARSTPRNVGSSSFRARK